jgi:Family of unknown function (DUF6193)
MILDMDAELYPDVVKAGGLKPFLQDRLIKLGSKIQIPSEKANEDFGTRFHLTIGAEERLFGVTLWRRAMSYAHLWARNSDDIAVLIDFWMSQEPSALELQTRFPNLKVNEASYFWEKGAVIYIEWLWNEGMNWFIESAPEMREVFLLARQNPKLNLLRPSQSHHILCFSRTTDYPFTRDCPMIEFWDGNYYVYSELSRKPKKPVAIGTAREIIEVAVTLLPENYDEIYWGTADELEKDSIQNSSFKHS